MDNDLRAALLSAFNRFQRCLTELEQERNARNRQRIFASLQHFEDAVAAAREVLQAEYGSAEDA